MKYIDTITNLQFSCYDAFINFYSFLIDNEYKNEFHEYCTHINEHFIYDASYTINNQMNIDFDCENIIDFLNMTQKHNIIRLTKF